MLYFDYSTDAREKKNSLKWADLVRIHVGWNMMWCTMITHLSILDLIASLGGDKIAPSFNKCNINKLTPSHASCFVFSTSMSFRLLLIILTSIDANYSTPCWGYYRVYLLMYLLFICTQLYISVYSQLQFMYMRSVCIYVAN